MAKSFIESHSESDTKNFAISMAKNAAKGDIYLLNGPLGAGKSVFARNFIQYFIGEDAEIPSPTFTLVQIYETHIAPIWHFDLYRLEEPDDIYELGWEEALHDSILLIEWPIRLGYLKPQKYTEIIIEPTMGQNRKITINKVRPSNDNQ